MTSASPEWQASWRDYRSGNAPVIRQVMHPGVRSNWLLDGKCPSCGCWSGLRTFNLQVPERGRVIGEGVVICICCAHRNSPEDNLLVLADLAEAANMRPEPLAAGESP